MTILLLILLPILTIQTPRLIVPDQSYRIKATLNTPQEYLIAYSELHAFGQYDIKVSFLSSHGLDVSFEFPEVPRPIHGRLLDTERYIIRTGKDRRVVGKQSVSIDGHDYYQFSIILRSNVHPNPYVIQPPLEYFLKVEEVVAPNFPPYVVQQITLAISLFIFVSLLVTHPIAKELIRMV